MSFAPPSSSSWPDRWPARLSPNLPVLAVSRFVQGLGGAMMMPVGRLVLLQTIAKRDLVAASSWLVMPGLAGQIIGPPLGGFIVTYLDWRWIFWINLPIGLLGILLIGRFISAAHERVHRPFDVVGLPAVRHRPGRAALRPGDRQPRQPAAPGRGPARHRRRRRGAVRPPRRARGTTPSSTCRCCAYPTFRLSVIGGSLTRITQGAQPFLLPLMMQLAFGLKASESGLITFGTSIGTFAMKWPAVLILHRLGFRRSLIAVRRAGDLLLCDLRPVQAGLAVAGDLRGAGRRPAS